VVLFDSMLRSAYAALDWTEQRIDAERRLHGAGFERLVSFATELENLSRGIDAETIAQ
jgi:hypothetical protein